MATYPIRQLADNGGTAQFVPVTAPEAVQFPDGSNLNTLIGSVATIESNPVASNHTVGEFLCVNGQVYEVIDAITAGDSIALGENVQVANLGSQITALNNGLTWKTAGQVTGTTSISLPSEYNEIFIISYAPTHYIYLQFIPRGALVSSERLIANGFQSSYYGTWYVSETAVRLGSYKDNGNDYKNACSTTVYYR